MNPAALPMGMFGLVGQRKPAEPFVWGRGGKRMSLDDIDLQRRLAAQEMADAGSFAPVGHWTQGLARSLGSVTGGIRMKRANKADEGRRAEAKAQTDAEIAALLANPNDRETVLRTLATGGEGAQTVAKLLAEPMFAKPAAPTEFERALAAGNILPGTPEYAEANRRYAMSKSDPQVTVTLPGGGIFVGPQSELAAVLQGGGGQVSGAPAGPPATLPPDFFDDDKGGAGASRVGSNFLDGL